MTTSDNSLPDRGGDRRGYQPRPDRSGDRGGSVERGNYQPPAPYPEFFFLFRTLIFVLIVLIHFTPKVGCLMLLYNVIVHANEVIIHAGKTRCDIYEKRAVD